MWMEGFGQVVDFFAQQKALFTGLLVLFLWGVRKGLLAWIRGQGAFINEKQRSWMSWTKNGIFALLVLSLFLLWKSEISQFALSVTAIAVAIVVASKEIILCFTGSIQRASSRSFRVGDWIEVGNLCGEVIEHNLMATVIQEIDLHHGQYHFNGKTATLPNSLFFTHPVKNLNFMKRYVFHNFTITVTEFVNLYLVVPNIMASIHEHCHSFHEIAKRYNSMIEKHAGVDLPSSEPHVHIQSTLTGEQLVKIMIFCPTEQATLLEQQIRADFMEIYHQKYPSERQ